MKKTLLLILSAWCFTCVGSMAQSTQYKTTILLSTIEDSGSWPCLYYELNVNSDIDKAVAAGCFSFDEDESYWQSGVGPFSTDKNRFFITDWASELHPLLVRRHFTLTSDDIANLSKSTFTLKCSYDEDPVIYLNGTKIANYSGWNDNNFATMTLTRSKRDLLVEGDNILCVSVKQGAGGGHIDYGLTMKTKVSTDGIETLQEEHSIEKAYTISGQRIGNENTAKGVYIIDGKKILR